MGRTHNDDFAYDNSGNALVEFFAKAGSLYTGKQSYYGNESSALDLFKGAWGADELTAMKLAMWVRDCRGGAGNRSGFRSVINWLAQNAVEWVKVNLPIIPAVGRWDDLLALIDTPCEAEAIKLWAEAIKLGDGLAAKWAPRHTGKKKAVFDKLRKALNMSPKDFRKLLAANTKVVETAMCSGNFGQIEYKGVPSVAMSRYAKAFGKRDAARFGSFKEALKKGETTVNAGALFPHDLVRMLKEEAASSRSWSCGDVFDSDLVNSMFEAMPNFFSEARPDLSGEAVAKVLAICDFSGSMETKIGGSVSAMDVSCGLGLYCSDRLGKDNPFYRMFIPFSADSRLVDWKNSTFSRTALEHMRSGYCGSTNMGGALMKILDGAKMFKASQEHMPNCLLILSDMQFDVGGSYSSAVSNGDETVVEKCMRAWEEAGYKRPRIVYWNLAGNDNSPARATHKDIALVSGFSPSLLKAIFAGDDFSPMGVMKRALEKYEVVEPY